MPEASGVSLNTAHRFQYTQAMGDGAR